MPSKKHGDGLPTGGNYGASVHTGADFDKGILPIHWHYSCLWLGHLWGRSLKRLQKRLSTSISRRGSGECLSLPSTLSLTIWVSPYASPGPYARCGHLSAIQLKNGELDG
jgi:hypothetical protein